VTSGWRWQLAAFFASDGATVIEVPAVTIPVGYGFTL
jgi:hypothetical protein